MILAALMQAFISATIKSVSSTTPLSLQVAFYYLIPVLCFLPLFFKNGFSTYKPKKFWVHFIRGFFSISAVCCVFYTIKYIPLGLSASLFNMIPFFVPIIAHFFLKEKVSLKTYMGLVVAFPGILLLVNPKVSSCSTIHVMIGLSAAILMATSMVLLKYLVREKESVNQIVFNQYSSCSLIAVLLMALEAIFNPSSFSLTKMQMNNTTIFLLLGLGVLSIGTQYCVSKAAQYMPVSQFAPYLYLSVPISSMLGLLFWGQNLSVAMMIGSALVFAGLCICSMREKVSALGSRGANS